MADEKCPKCGELLALHSVCPLCKGSGQVRQSSFTDPATEINEDCHECRGTGRLRDCIDVLRRQLAQKETENKHLRAIVDGWGHWLDLNANKLTEGAMVIGAWDSTREAARVALEEEKES